MFIIFIIFIFSITSFSQLVCSYENVTEVQMTTTSRQCYRISMWPVKHDLWTSRSRDRLETSEGLVSVSSRKERVSVSVSSRAGLQTSRSRLGLGAERLGLGLGLDREGLGDMVPRP